MRKSVLAAALTLLLVGVGTALAGTSNFTGRGVDDRKVSVTFEAHGPKNSNGEVELPPRRVADFSISGATQTVTCAGVPGKQPVSYFFEEPMRVEDGVFFAKEKVEGPGDQTASVKGHFEGGNSRTARGWFHLRGKAGGCSVETGRVKWVATGT